MGWFPGQTSPWANIAVDSGDCDVFIMTRMTMLILWGCGGVPRHAGAHRMVRRRDLKRHSTKQPERQ